MISPNQQQTSANEPHLYVVSTPIGNLEDISNRALTILSTVNTILAEDTRVSSRLLSRFNITTPLLSYHDFNKEKITPKIISQMKKGVSHAIITDAGTPGISDPAFFLVRAALREQLIISPAPGPSALLAGLVCSGLPCDRFIFENFLPVKSGKRKKLLETFSHEKRTVIFYESPHRIVKVLQAMHEILGDIPVVIGRELTKLHEEFLRGTPRSLLEHFSCKKPRGEFVVMFNSRISSNPPANNIL